MRELLYRFEFPAHEDARLVLNVARKIGKATALTNGAVTIDPASGTFDGGGTFDGNWNPAPYRLFFAARVDAKPVACGTWSGSNSVEGASSARIETRDGLGAWLRFDARQTRTVHLKIAVSFTSAERAAQYASQVQALEDRVRVLERIVTDRGYDIATQIEALRDARKVEALLDAREPQVRP